MYRKRACDEEVHRKEGQEKEGMKEIRTGRGHLYRKNEIKKYIRKEG